jgi:hypothetical protein
MDQVKKLESKELSAMSSRIDNQSNKRDIIRISKEKKGTGLISPYLSKISVPSDSKVQSS